MGRKSIVVMMSMAVAYAITILLLLLIAFILYKTHLSQQYVQILICAVYVISNMAGGYLCARKMNCRRLIWGVVSAMGYFCLLYLLSAVIGGENGKTGYDVIKMGVCCLLGGGIGSLLS